jgi:PAS domain S-box-containing protein
MVAVFRGRSLPGGEDVGLLHRLAGKLLGRRSGALGPDAGDLLESAPDGVIIVDSSGKIVSVNSQTEVLFGYRREELIGQPVELLVPARFHRIHLQHRASFSAEPHVRPMGRDLDLFGTRKDGSEFPVEISLSPLQTKAGMFVTSTVRDVTDRKRYEEQIRRLNAELAEALRRAERLGTPGELATTMAREMDAPMEELGELLLQLRARTSDDPALQELLTKAQNELLKISQITGRAKTLQEQHEAWKKR